jgi:hypothetical protein
MDIFLACHLPTLLLFIGTASPRAPLLCYAPLGNPRAADALYLDARQTGLEFDLGLDRSIAYWSRMFDNLFISSPLFASLIA